MAPLSPGFLKSLSDTVTTFAVFPSWMYLLGGDDKCMLSGPSSTCDPRISCWQGGDICQAKAPAAFTLFSCELRSSFNYGCSPFNSVLLSCYLLDVSRLFGLTLRPSAPVFRCHRVSWARGRLAFAQEALRVSPFSFFSIFLLLLIFVRSLRQPSSKLLSSGIEM